MFLGDEDNDNQENKKADFQKIWKSAHYIIKSVRNWYD